MARSAGPKKSAKTASKGRGPGRPPAARVAAAPTAKRAGAPPPAPKLSKDEMRVQLDKLERAHATLRAKSRAANKDAKAAATRIAELEEQVAKLEKRLATQKAATQKPAAETPAKPKARRARKHAAEHEDVPPHDDAIEPSDEPEAESDTADADHDEHPGPD